MSLAGVVKVVFLVVVRIKALGGGWHEPSRVYFKGE
jgi:hypothetical protein